MLQQPGLPNYHQADTKKRKRVKNKAHELKGRGKSFIIKYARLVEFRRGKNGDRRTMVWGGGGMFAVGDQ